jgi:hypothetical protein
MELEAANESSEDGLVLEQRELHADADPRTFREGEEAAPATAHLVYGGEPALTRCAVLGFGGVAAADEPARGAEDIGIAEDVFVAVDGHRGNVDHLALLDWDRFDPGAISTANGVAEGDHIIILSDLLHTRHRREHAHDLLAHGVKVGKAVGVAKVVVGRLVNDSSDFLAELGLDVRVPRKFPRGESNRRGSRLVAGNAVN